MAGRVLGAHTTVPSQSRRPSESPLSRYSATILVCAGVIFACNSNLSGTADAPVGVASEGDGSEGDAGTGAAGDNGGEGSAGAARSAGSAGAANADCGAAGRVVELETADGVKLAGDYYAPAAVNAPGVALLPMIPPITTAPTILQRSSTRFALAVTACISPWLPSVTC